MPILVSKETAKPEYYHHEKLDQVLLLSQQRFWLSERILKKIRELKVW